MGNAWTKAVNTAFKIGRKTRKTYSLKEAMFAAKKIYKKGANVVVDMGRQTRRPKKGNKRRRTHRGGKVPLNPASVGGAVAPLNPASVGGAVAPLSPAEVNAK
jgi:hypothetical protein